MTAPTFLQLSEAWKGSTYTRPALTAEAANSCAKKYMEGVVHIYDAVEERLRSRFRKDGVTPLIWHPLGVALGCKMWMKRLTMLLASARNNYQNKKEFRVKFPLGPPDVPQTDLDVLVIALLHDMVEDGTCTWKELYELAGGYILEGVWWLTDPIVDKEVDRRLRKTIAVKHICGAPWRVRMVKLIDRWHNLLTAPERDPFYWGENAAYLDETTHLLDALQGTVRSWEEHYSVGNLVFEVRKRVEEMREESPGLVIH